MKALIAIDGSKHSMEAVAQVGQLLSAERDQAVFYYSPTELFTIENAAGNSEVLARARAALVTAVFGEARSHLPENMRDLVECITGTQPAAHGILVAAKNCSADLIAMGARGLGPVKQMLLGSASRWVVHHSEVPIFVARARQRPGHAHLRALLACAGEKECRWLSESVNKLTLPKDSIARTISVLPSVLGDNDVPEWLKEYARQAESDAVSRAWRENHAAEIGAKQVEMSECKKFLPEAFRNSTPLVAEGHPAEQILEAATRDHADLIIMGTHVQGLIARFLVGSTCEAVMSHAHCSLLIVPAAELP